MQINTNIVIGNTCNEFIGLYDKELPINEIAKYSVSVPVVCVIDCSFGSKWVDLANRTHKLSVDNVRLKLFQTNP